MVLLQMALCFFETRNIQGKTWNIHLTFQVFIFKKIQICCMFLCYLLSENNMLYSSFHIVYSIFMPSSNSFSDSVPTSYAFYGFSFQVNRLQVNRIENLSNLRGIRYGTV